MIRPRAISPQHIVEITRTPPGLQRLRHHPLCHTTSLRVGFILCEDPASLPLVLQHLPVAPLPCFSGVSWLSPFSQRAWLPVPSAAFAIEQSCLSNLLAWAVPLSLLPTQALREFECLSDITCEPQPCNLPSHWAPSDHNRRRFCVAHENVHAASMAEEVHTSS